MERQSGLSRSANKPLFFFFQGLLFFRKTLAMSTAKNEWHLGLEVVEQ